MSLPTLTLRFLFETYQFPTIHFREPLRFPCPIEQLEISQAGALGDGVGIRREFPNIPNLFYRISPYRYPAILDVLVRASTFTTHPFSSERLPIRLLAERYYLRILEANGCTEQMYRFCQSQSIELPILEEEEEEEW